MSNRMRRRRPYAPLLLVTVVIATWMATGFGSAATSGSVVGATVLSSTSLADSCTHPTALGFGTVTVSTSNLTTGGANVCRFQFGSSNGTATARLFQRDRTGTAMGGLDTTSWATSKAGDATPNTLAMATALVSWVGFSDGTVLRTPDDGTTWPAENPQLPASHALYSLAAVDADTAYGVGGFAFASPVIRKRTLGGGPTWAIQTVPAAVTGMLMDVAYLPGTPNTAVAVSLDGKILRTTDGGANWGVVHSYAGQITEVSFQSATLAYAIGSSDLVLRSTDSGATWTQVASTPVGGVSHVTLSSGPTAWITVGTTLYRSQDPTAATPTWSNVYTNANTFCGLGTPSVPTATNLFVPTGCQSVVMSNDANVATPTFASNAISTRASASALHARTATHMRAISSAILRSANGSAWTIERQLTDAGLAIDSFGAQVAMVTGGTGYSWVTTDGGASWQQRASGGPHHLFGVDLTSATTAWAAGSSGRVYRTSNLGTSWTVINTGVTTNDFRDIVDLGDGTIVAVGLNGTIIRSIDDGITWSLVASSAGANYLIRIDVDSVTGRIWIVGWAGTTLTSTDRGATFVSRPTGDADDFGAVTATGANSAWVGGNNGSMWKTTDGGVTWAAVPSPFGPTVVIGSLDSAGAQDVAIGTAPNADRARTTDGGATWTTVGGWVGSYEVEMVDARTTLALYGNSVAIQQATPVISDYLLGTADWANGSAFGVCLQAVGANTTPIWSVDDGGIAGQCETNVADDWYAVPSTPTPVASTNVTGATGAIDLVWGLRTSSSQLPGRYVSSVNVEVVSP